LIFPPLGRSDHNCVYVASIAKSCLNVGKRSFYKRSLTPSAIDAIANDLVSFNWSKLYTLASVQSQADMFYDIVTSSVDRHAPSILCMVKNNDKPWVSDHFRELVRQRDFAFSHGDKLLYCKLRN
jgi:hypothetical protein